MLDFSDCNSSKKVFEFFEEISKIPRGSTNTSLIADYLVNFAKVRGLEVIRDSADNVIIRKGATSGYEDKPGIILQGHTDIVALKEPGCPIDMDKEGLKPFRDGDFIRAEGTTLGADDGVAIAYALAILDSESAEHPELEAVFTSDEEIGLLGATALDTACLKGRLLINIDSDDEGVFTVGCAGGARVDIAFPVCKKTFIGKVFTLSISGLRGGHSGVEIDKNRANAIKTLAEILSELKDIRIGKIMSGSADNAIPSEATATFTSKSSIMEVSEIINNVKATLPEEESEVKFNVNMNFGLAKLLKHEDSENILSLISEIPNGVTNMSKDIEGLVETSLNMGILNLLDNGFQLTISVRSSKGTEKTKLLDIIKTVAKKHGATVSVRGEYPAWEYKADSHLRDVMVEVYEKMYNKSPEVLVIHAGLECGIFSSKIEGLDCVSIGPDNYDIHTPNEHLSISSTVRVYEYLLEVLKNL